MSDTSKLTKLGSQKTKYDFRKPNIKLLETFKNQHQDQMYLIPIEAFECSSLCPKTGQPDYFKLFINYVPRKKCVESKSLKLYLFSFRNSGEFMEDITNRIARDLVNKLDPLYLEVYADFNARGGIYLRPYVKWIDNSQVDEVIKEIKSTIYDYRMMKKSI